MSQPQGSAASLPLPRQAAGLAIEQGMFLVSGFWVWMSAVGGERGRAGNRTGTGVVALLLTSMHMTLLGALLALGPRPLYDPAICGFGTLGALEDQQLGGVLMLLVGGASYLLGGLVLMARLLRGAQPAQLGGRP